MDLTRTELLAYSPHVKSWAIGEMSVISVYLFCHSFGDYLVVSSQGLLTLLYHASHREIDSCVGTELGL